MKDKTQRPIVSKGSPVVPMLAALTLLGLGIYTAPVVFGELKTGQAYTLAVVFGNGAKVQRDSSPVDFWLNAGLHILAFCVQIILGIAMLLGIAIDYKRKVAERRKDNEAKSLKR